MGALEDRLETIIDKSTKDLLNITTEYHSQKQQWEKSLNPPPRGSRYSSVIPSSTRNERFVFDHIVNDIENVPPCGPYQQAAVNAFHATRNGSRHRSKDGRAADDIRAAEARMQQDVDRLVNDKFKCTSIAIDALRDQLVILADELRQLSRNATLQERRVEVLSHDVESRRGIINSMEAHMLDENGRIKSIGLEMERLKEDVATKASFVDVKTGMKSNRLKSKTSLSDLKAQLKRESSAVMNEVNDLKEWIQKQYSEGLEKQMNQISSSTQAFQRNLVETMKRMIHEEVALTEQKCLVMIEKEVQKISTQNNNDKNKEHVKLISQIVTKAATKIESNLREDLEKKLEKMVDVKQKDAHQQSTAVIDNRIQEMMVPDLVSIKESLKQLRIEQEHCISKDKAELLTETCRVQLAQSMSRLEDEFASVASNAYSTATSMSEKILKKWKIDHENVLNRLQHFITKDEASDIANAVSTVHFDNCMSMLKQMETKSELRFKAHVSESQQKSREMFANAAREVASAVAKHIFDEQYERWDNAATTACGVDTQIDECKAQLMNTFSEQLRNYATKDEASGIAEVKSKIEADRCFQVTADRCHSTAGKLVDLEAKLEEIESDFGGEIFKMINLVKSIDDRVSSMENVRNDQIYQKEDNTRNCAQVNGFIADPSNVETIKGGTHRSKMDIPTMSIQQFMPFQKANVGPPVAVNDDDKSEPSTDSDSSSERACASAGSNHCVSGNDNREVGEQRTLIQERNRMLSNVARTLSAVATKRDDSSLRQLAAELRAGKLTTETLKTHDQVARIPDHPPPKSDEESIDTAHAMSLCGVHLDESHDGTRSEGTRCDDNNHRSKSPASFVGTIDTAEAISLCRGAQFPSDQDESEILSPLHASYEEYHDVSTEKNLRSTIENSLPISISTSHSLQNMLKYSSTLERGQIGTSLKQSSCNVQSQKLSVGYSSAVSDFSENAHQQSDHSVGSESGGKQPNTSKKQQISALVSENVLGVANSLPADPAGGSTGVSSLVSRNVDDDVPQETIELHVPKDIPTESHPLVNEDVKVSQLPSVKFVLSPFSHRHNSCSFMEDEASLPGSLTSADEIFDCNASSHQYNPTRMFNPEPYRGWDALLTELKASGRTLRDGDSSEDSNSVSSYGSNSFESESAKITD